MAHGDESADVVVIGSGAGGAPVALTLAEAGARVIILERGPWYAIRDFTHDEVAITRRDFFAPYPYAGYDPHTLRTRLEEKAHRSAEGWTGVCVGGGTVHMSGFTYRAQRSDFDLATRVGGLADADLADWPITLAELLPYYDRVEARLGVSGVAGQNPFETRHQPFPMPPLPVHPTARLVDAAAKHLGFHPFTTPRAIVSRAYGSRPPCTLCGLCVQYGCENTSKSSTLSTMLPDAEATGRCQIKAKAMATRIIADGNDQVVGVEYTDAAGHQHFIKARVVCVAASAVESARLLLMSESPRFPTGLANRNGLVGRHLTFSTFAKATALFDIADLVAALGNSDMDLPFVNRSVQDDYWREDGSLPFPKGGTYNFLLHNPSPINAGLRLVMEADWKLWGSALKDRLRQYFQEELWLEFEVFSECLPWRGSYVDLDPEVTDSFGLPVARITNQHHPMSDQVSRAMLTRGMRILEAMKPAPKAIRPWTWGSDSYHLQQGTIRMGNDPATSVLDRFCEAHEVKNLFVTDSSFMPTSTGVPATPTIMANSFRVGDYIVGRLKRREVDG